MLCWQIGRFASLQVEEFTGCQVGKIVASWQVDKFVCFHSDRLLGLQVAMILGCQVGRIGSSV